MSEINRLPKFEFSDALKEAVKLANELHACFIEQAYAEERQFWEAWDRRAVEVAELERLAKL